MAKKEPIPDGSNREFKKVMKGVRGDNPEHKRRVKAEAEKAKRVKKAQEKVKGTHRRKSDGGGDVIDSGMFR